MRKLKALIFTTLIAFLIQFAWIPASYAAVPPGSYTLTCTGSYMKDDTLFSTCADRSGMYKRTGLKKPNNCHGDIANIDGRLRCLFSTLPPGSYTLSCDDIYEEEGTDLIAFCKTKQGSSEPTRLENYQECKTGTIDNIDGNLVCDRL